MTIVELCVHMDCAGCETKIRKAIQRLEGVDDVDVDMARQKVTVMGWVEQKKVLKAVRKTGRRAVIWPYSSVDMHNSNWSYNQTNPTPAVTGYYSHHHHPANIGPGASSSYNYYKHGYDDFRGHGYGYGYDQYSGGGGGSSIFSDENPNACSIM